MQAQGGILAAGCLKATQAFPKCLSGFPLPPTLGNYLTLDSERVPACAAAWRQSTDTQVEQEVMPMNSLTVRDLEQHVPILGWLLIVGHALFLAIGVFVFVLLTGIGAVSGEEEAMAILTLAAIGV